MPNIASGTSWPAPSHLVDAFRQRLHQGGLEIQPALCLITPFDGGIGVASDEDGRMWLPDGLGSARVEVHVLTVVLGGILGRGALMASMRSSSSAPRVFGSVPWSRNSSIFQPAPTPNTNRPAEIRSMLAASLAVMIGSRWISGAIPVNSSIWSHRRGSGE